MVLSGAQVADAALRTASAVEHFLTVGAEVVVEGQLFARCNVTVKNVNQADIIII